MTDHPRVCGEQFPRGFSSRTALGSPPRVRGTGWNRSVGTGGAGITPACAGNRFPANTFISGKTDHPRVCGEQFIINGQAFCKKGSPPRVRGTVGLGSAGTGGQRITPACAGSRITPACAGNRCSKPSTPPRLGDHPRVCGEQHPDRFFIGHSPGSPPRVRGTVIKEEKMSKAARITPACAGNSSSIRDVSSASRDHPRVCGEQAAAPALEPGEGGSPPRVRGTAP